MSQSLFEEPRLNSDSAKESSETPLNWANSFESIRFGLFSLRASCEGAISPAHRLLRASRPRI